MLSRSAGETARLGETLGRLAGGGTVLLLVGDLGSGKTALVQGLARGLGIRGPVQSPTFTLVNEHPAPERGVVLYHVDLYRLHGGDDVRDLGLDEVCGAAYAICAVEWADRVPGLAPADHLRIAIEIAGARRRRLHLRATGPRHRDLLERLRATEADFAAGA